MSIQPPDKSFGPYKPQGSPQHGDGPLGPDPGKEFSSYMKQGSSNSPSVPPTPLDPNSAPVFTPPDPTASLKRAPKPDYPETLNGLPNAQYYFHFTQSDVMCTDPYPNNPPNPGNYGTYPKATFHITPPNKKDPSGAEVGVVRLPIPYKDPKNPSAKYYDWNYMYVRQGDSGNWQYCGNGPSLRIGELPMNYGLWQKYFPWETEQFILKPMAQQFQQQQQQEAADRKRREQIYKDEANG